MATNGVSINASGVDTETLIQTAIKNDQDRYDKLYKKKIEQEWTKEAYNAVYGDVKNYWNNDTSNYKLSSNTTARVASSSNSDAVTATVTADAVEMTHDVKVNNVASAAYLQTFDKVDVGDGNSKADLATMMNIDVTGKESSDDIALSFVLNDGKKESVVSFTYKELSQGKTLNDLASRISRAGLNLSAVYDSTNQSFSITNKDTGIDNSISITADITKSDVYQNAASTVAESQRTLGTSFDYNTVDNLLKAKIAAEDTLNSTTRTDSTGNVTAAYQQAQQALDDANKAYNDHVASLGLSDDETSALSKYSDAKSTMNRYGVSDSYQDAAVAKEQARYELIDAYGTDFDTTEIDALVAAGNQTAIDDYINNKSSGVADIQNALQNYVQVTKDYNTANTTSSTASQELLSKLNFAAYNAADGSFNKVDADKLAAGVAGTNASVTIDGKTYDNLQSNNISVANVNYTFNSVSTGTTKITVSTDTDSLIETVQNFVDSYNKLLDMLNEKVHETYYSDYGALTEEEEGAMTESQLEKWNAKAQSGLLRKSSELQNIIDKMREAISTPIEGLDGDYNSLASIGISASGDWDEYGHLYIDSDKLKTAISEDPDVFYKLMSTNTKDYDTQGVAFRLSDIMKDGLSAIEGQAGTTTGSDDQSYIGLKIQDYNTRLKSLQDIIDTKYDFYYKKYSAMEQAISNMQSTMNSFTSYLGTGS